MPRQNLPQGQFRRGSGLRRRAQAKDFGNKFNRMHKATAWHGVRMVNGGSRSWEWRASSTNLSGEQRMSSVDRARVFEVICAVLLAWAVSAVPAAATSRIKDLANIEGVRQNQLVGYGLSSG